MSTLLTSPPTQAAQQGGHALDLDARMALTEVVMTCRLDEAAVGFEVNAAHIGTTPVDLADVVQHPIEPLLPPLVPYPTPVAALLQRATRRMETFGWCRGMVADEDGATCEWGAIRAEAGGDAGLEAQAMDVLLEAIRRRYPTAVRVQSWNDAQTDGRLPVRVLGEAAGLANARGI